MNKPIKSDLYSRIHAILESARTTIARSVNTTQVIANWLIGREIVVEEQMGRSRAVYGARLLSDLSERLQKEFGTGYSINNLEHFRNFYLSYPDLVIATIPHASRGILTPESQSPISHAPRGKSDGERKIHVPSEESWKPGRLNPNLSWTHYRILLKVKKNEARSFYEIEMNTHVNTTLPAGDLFE